MHKSGIPSKTLSKMIKKIGEKATIKLLIRDHGMTQVEAEQYIFAYKQGAIK